MFQQSFICNPTNIEITSSNFDISFHYSYVIIPFFIQNVKSLCTILAIDSLLLIDVGPDKSNLKTAFYLSEIPLYVIQ